MSFNAALGHHFRKELSEILGIPALLDVDIHFGIAEVVTATAKFRLNEVQAKAIVQLCRDCKWRSAEVAESGNATSSSVKKALEAIDKMNEQALADIKAELDAISKANGFT